MAITARRQICRAQSPRTNYNIRHFTLSSYFLSSSAACTLFPPPPLLFCKFSCSACSASVYTRVPLFPLSSLTSHPTLPKTTLLCPFPPYHRLPPPPLAFVFVPVPNSHQHLSSSSPSPQTVPRIQLLVLLYVKLCTETIVHFLLVFSALGNGALGSTKLLSCTSRTLVKSMRMF